MKKLILFASIFISFAILFGKSFVDHSLWLMTEGLQDVIQGRWDLVFFNVVIFSSFLFLLSFGKKANWRTSGIYSAFIISLFVEMYGFPLSIYLASSIVQSPVNYTPDWILSFNFLKTNFILTQWMLAGLVVTILGSLLVILGWNKIYKSKSLVTSGIYKYSRHPQYFGIILISFGWLIGWTTLLTILMFPILTFSYYRLSRREENYLEKKFGKKFLSYKRKVPMFI